MHRTPKLPRRLSLLLVPLAGLAGCQTPPPEAYVGGAHAEGDGVAIGRDAAGEVCRQYVQPGGGADIYCGTWKQPAARVRPVAEAGALAEQASVFTASLAPRVVNCGAPQPLSFAGADAAVQMACTRASGGWPHAALVAQSGGRVWYANGVASVLPAMERSIGVLTGRVSPDTAPPAEPPPAASRSLGVNDLGLYQALIRDGAEANRTGNWEEAAALFRRAVELQEKVAGRNSAAQVDALTGLAVQLSNQGRFAEARATFARAEALAASPNAANAPLLQARLAHYRGLDQLNQGHPQEALEQLRAAERLYAATLPEGVVENASQASLASRFAPTQTSALLTGRPNVRPSLDASALEALLGVIETRRNQSIALRELGDNAGAVAAVDSAEAFARAQGLTNARVSAFVYRTAGVTVLGGARPGEAVGKLDASVTAFTRGLPRTLSLAATQFRRAEALLKDGKPAEAVAVCQTGSQLLRDLKQGIDGTLLQPCLAAYAAQARSAADPQPLLAEMFETAQLSRGAITAEQIQRAAVRLAAAPEVGRVLRVRDDADAKLDELLRQKDELASPDAPPAAARTAELEAQIAQARGALAQADEDLQAALPNYNALVQQAVPAATLFGVLRPGEAFAATSLGEAEGWTFLLRDHVIRIGHIAGGAPRITTLVARVRASIEPAGNTVPTFDTAAAQELSRRHPGRSVRGAGRRRHVQCGADRRLAVVAFRGAAHRPGLRCYACRCAVPGEAVPDRARAVGGQSGQSAPCRRARAAVLVWLWRFPPDRPGRGGAALSGQRLRGKCQPTRQPAGAAGRAAGAGGGAPGDGGRAGR